jgi:hypothetical protein
MLIDCSGQHCVLIALWECLLDLDSEVCGAGNLFEILAYLDNTNVIDEYLDSGNLLHALGRTSEPDCSAELIASLRRWMEFLKKRDYDFEQTDMQGRTPLLDHLHKDGRQNLEAARLLLEFGANVHATDFTGRNALQCAMSNMGWVGVEMHRKTLELKLCLLIKAGADVSHCDKAGDTPTDYAQEHYDCWDEWCRALESNGLDVHEITHAEKERRKISQEQERQESEGIAAANKQAAGAP